jgi:hypothetical protein
MSARDKRLAQDRQTELLRQIEAAEKRVAEIDALFAEAGFYAKVSGDERKRLESERAARAREAEELMAEWEKAEEAIGASS